MATKTPKQVLLEFYALYPNSHKPTFQVVAVPSATPQGGPQFTATVVCPTVERAPGDVAFRDLMFEGHSSTKRGAEHDCASKAYAHIRGIPGLQLPSTRLPVSFLDVSQHHQVQGVPGFAAPGSVPMASPAAAAPGAMAVGHALTPTAPAAPPLSLAINEEAIAGMGVVDLQHALTEVLEQYKNLVHAVHAESQRFQAAAQGLHAEMVRNAHGLHAEMVRHAAELHTLISRQL